MRKLLLACSFVFATIFLLGGDSFAQSTAFIPKNSHTRAAVRYANEGLPTRHVTPAKFPSSGLSELVSVAGAVDMGVTGKWHDQSNGGPLHRIQVDPANPNNVHAVIMSAFGVT